ncbi:hypothetical protein EIN_470920 [Entamoeba invadens IP1]|uniref:Uncharacterized protein n=1 Tax=Entamoeba invadens IP1 TaxID=370355 RepID=A0A0A1TWR2_ENTIV|nr:hypothetical protein EIN_470920 [Entamoeba invadens IP1]ELP83788.1 hypothetical protein EIN_470920 [Entamoeba invadens IP1]|eukprot:XP_004183134.1 hypothetical protein EIN_470920 [Entamoeba invadens IP1]
MNYSFGDNVSSEFVYVLSDFGGGANELENIMSKCLQTKLEISNPWIQEYGFMVKQTIEVPDICFDLSNSELIQEITLKNVNAKHVVLPIRVKKIAIENVEGEIVMEKCTPHAIRVCGYTGKQLVLNDEKLSVVEYRDVLNGVNFIHNNMLYSDKYVIDLDKIKSIDIDRLPTVKCVVFIKNNKTLFEGNLSAVHFREDSLSIENLANDIDITEFGVNSFSVFKTSNTPNMVLGNVCFLTIMKGEFNSIYIGDCQTITLRQTNIKKLDINVCNTFTYKSSKITTVKGKKIESINGTKKAIKNWEIENSSGINNLKEVNN